MTTPSTEWPTFIEYVSKIHAITCAFVPTSGAGMSFSGPISLMISVVKRRVSRSSSSAVSCFGSQTTAPFAPPNGRPISAHFHVIHIASAFTSSRVTPGWYRIPPFAGPRVTLCTTRYPSNTLVLPSSIDTGTETSTDFLHSERTLIRFGSTPNVSPTRRSCARASA